MTTEEKPAPWGDLRAIADHIVDCPSYREDEGWRAKWDDIARLRQIADSMEDQYEQMRDQA